MTFKKVFSIMLVICMVLSFSACGSKGDDESSSKSSSKSGLNLFSNDKSTDESSDDSSGSGSKGSLFGSGDSSDNEDEASTGDGESSGSGSGSGSDEGEFSDGGLGSDEGEGDGLFSDGGLGSDEGSDENSSDSSIDDPFASLQEVDIPKGFPKDVYPIYIGSKVYLANKSTSDGIDTFQIAFEVKADADSILKFYEEKLGSAEDFSSQNGGGLNFMSGTLGGYSFQVLVGEDNNKAYTIITMELKEVK